MLTPAYLSVGAVCNSIAAVLNTALTQVIGFLLGPSGVSSLQPLINLQPFCDAISFMRVNPLG